jgi:hypothetical protein
MESSWVIHRFLRVPGPFCRISYLHNRYAQSFLDRIQRRQLHFLFSCEAFLLVSAAGGNHWLVAKGEIGCIGIEAIYFMIHRT